MDVAKAPVVVRPRQGQRLLGDGHAVLQQRHQGFGLLVAVHQVVVAAQGDRANPKPQVGETGAVPGHHDLPVAGSLDQHAGGAAAGAVIDLELRGSWRMERRGNGEMG